MTMSIANRLRLDEVERRVCDIASVQLGISRHRISPSDRLLDDLNCESLDTVELFMEIEEQFHVTMPESPSCPIYKAVFTRQPFRLADLAELVYLQQGTGRPDRSLWRGVQQKPSVLPALPFTQLGGQWDCAATDAGRMYERLKTDSSLRRYRRRADGMQCVLIPSANVEIGCDAFDALADERPMHVVEINAFLIDLEPVSTTAYCRFLNSIGDLTDEVLADWFVLDHDDDSNVHVLIRYSESGWRPVPGTECWPMILVSWYGANAYSIWANGCDWTNYRGEAGAQKESYLPSEAQWEYAARGAGYRTFPWGDDPPSQQKMRYGQHKRSVTYRADTLPMADVNTQLGMSPFGLHHMAGNVWQWCRDWYEESFYLTREAIHADPIQEIPTPVKSERGGSWIGPGELCRSSYRRGRPPLARGRCLGFRCVGSAMGME
jgi:sulfatase modifying factor 1